MSDKSFFKTTNLYKEYIILDLIGKNKDITQRELGKHLGVAVSMVNSMLDSIEELGFIKRKKYTSKTVEYILTKKGNERKKFLNIGYLSSAQKLYDSAKENIEIFIDLLEIKDVKEIILYGAGEVCEILLNSILSRTKRNLVVLGIIDDDQEKLGKLMLSTEIIPIEDISLIKHDGILISSFSNNKIIYEKLIEFGYSKEKIIQFF
jgi:DNA-binding MarR family transcriptional regulator